MLMIAQQIKVCNLESEPGLSNTKALVLLIVRLLVFSFSGSQLWADSRVSQVPGALVGSPPGSWRIPDPGSALKTAEAMAPGEGVPGARGRESSCPPVSAQLTAAAAGEGGRGRWGPRSVWFEDSQR